MREIGQIKQVQVQPSSLKIGQGSTTYYDPVPLCVVNGLQISKNGAIGITANGGRILDVHHVDYPRSRHHQGINGLSFGFTSHYRAMREKFGSHLIDGCAGENILIESTTSYTLDDLGDQLAIQIATTGQIVYLTGLVVAAPCVPFSQFATNPLSNQQIKEALQFLDNGRRGFYAALADPQQEAVVQAGDRVFH